MTAYVPLRSATERERVAFLIPHPGYGDISLFIVHRNLLQILHGFQDLITADVDDGAAGSFNVLSGNGNPSDVIILRDLIHDIQHEVLDDGALEAIAEKAMKKETGARALRAIIEEFMLDIMYEIPKDENIGEVTITRSYIEGTGGPLISLRGQEVPRLP